MWRYKRVLKRILKAIDKEIDNITEQIKELIGKNSKLRYKQDMMETVVGIGDKVSTVILAKLPELGDINRKKIAALVGVAPYRRESGKYRGQSR